MSQVIIYKEDNGVLAIVFPTTEAVDTFGIMFIAKKDVPSGKPFKIIDKTDLPSDLSLRNAWTVDDHELTDGVGEGE